MTNDVYNRNISERQKQLLQQYYSRRRKMIIIVVSIIAVVLLLSGGLAFCYFNNLFFFGSGNLELVLKTDNEVVLYLSKIDEFNVEDYVKSRTEKNTTLYAPDINEVKDKPGKYELEYVLESNKTKETVKAYLTVIVRDDVPPTLKLTDKQIEVDYDSTVNLKKYIAEASDNVDGEDLSGNVTYDTLNTKKPGEYTVTFSLEDEAGNEATSDMKVTVLDESGQASSSSSKKSSSSGSSSSSSSSKKSSSSGSSSGSSSSKKSSSSGSSSSSSSSKKSSSSGSSSGSSSSKKSSSSGSSSSSSSSKKSSSSGSSSSSSSSKKSSSSGSSSSSSGNSSSSSSSSDSAAKKSLNGKTFLYADGYNSSNVMSACQSTLSKAGVSGSCVPLYENGVVIGAKIVIK